LHLSPPFLHVSCSFPVFPFSPRLTPVNRNCNYIPAGP
jgi:hypothetical protein